MKSWNSIYLPPGATGAGLAVPVRLTTNLDLHDGETMPKRLFVPPVVGLRLQSSYSHANAPDYRLTLEVCRVTHLDDGLEVELHLCSIWKNRTLNEFYKDHYEKITGRWFI
jgi:hypothetical protein